MYIQHPMVELYDILSFGIALIIGAILHATTLKHGKPK